MPISALNSFALWLRQLERVTFFGCANKVNQRNTPRRPYPAVSFATSILLTQQHDARPCAACLPETSLSQAAEGCQLLSKVEGVR